MDRELEWNKNKKIADDFSTAELLFDKQRAGPPFVFRETMTMFILTAHLEGYKRDDIKVQINKGGKRVAVIGEKQVQETVMVGNKTNSKEMVMKGFTKVFHFSDGVRLDEANATFSKYTCQLTISIPKLEKGFRGTRVEEVKQEEIGATYELLEIEEFKVDKLYNNLERGKYREGDVEKRRTKHVMQEEDKEELEKRKIVQEFDQTRTRQVETFKDQEMEEKQRSVNPNESKQVQKPDSIEDRESESEQEKLRIEEEKGEIAKSDECPKIKKDKCKLCNPVILGSTILVTISVLVICFIRSQNPHRKRKN